jgi:2-iminobutanoate/2-iminopropanoate deaminase
LLNEVALIVEAALKIVSFVYKVKMLKYINVAQGPMGPYSQAVIVGELAFVSGQLPQDPKTGLICGENIEEQTDRAMKNLAAILGQMCSDFSHVVKTTIYTTDLSQIHVINRVYTKWMGAVRPARTVLQVAALPLGAFIEIEMIIKLGSNEELMLFQPADEEALHVKKTMSTHEMKRS